MLNAPQIEMAVEALLAKMTLEEKVLCCHAGEKFATTAIERLNLPKLTMSDGPHGVREELSPDSWDALGGDDDFCTYLPTGTALAATWSRECAEAFGKVLGAEARERRKDVILGPGVNMVRSPLCGRNFEYYCEDPYLAGELAAESIRGIQSQGTAACVKHFAMNSQELNRNGVDARCDERTLREIYLPAFESAVKKGKAMTLMAAYNLVHGEHCCENDRLLNEILKKEWGFDGLVISDWAGVHDTLLAARGGMDLEMGSGDHYEQYYLADAFLNALKKGEIDENVLDDKVRRYLRLFFKLGKLGDRPRPAGERNSAAHQATTKAIAEEAIVLLKNDGNMLPLCKENLKKLLVLGENATRVHHYGGHSSAIKALYEVTPLEGLKHLLKDSNIEISYSPGYGAALGGGAPIPSKLMGLADAGAGTRGWIGQFFDKDVSQETPVVTMPMEQLAFDPDRDLPEALRNKNYCARFSGVFTPDKTGNWTFYLAGNSQAALVTPGENWIENCKSRTDLTGSVTMHLEAGHAYELTVPYVWHVDQKLFPVRLSVAFEENATSATSDKALADLEAAARAADAVVIFGGLNHNFDCEGTDRKDMQLHDGQNELIAQVAAWNPRTVVALVGGSPVEMPWIDQVPAVLQLWYGGMEIGNAAAAVLFGEVNPSGKLPFTFPKSYQDTPEVRYQDYHADVCYYKEGVFMGYRYYDRETTEVLFPFGHGLSYTSFMLDKPMVERPQTPGGVALARIAVTNTGTRAGKCVVQLYLAPQMQIPGIARPERELKGFAKTQLLAPGASEVLTFALDLRSFSYYDVLKRAWVAEPGEYRVEFGESSRSLTAATMFVLKSAH